MADPVGIAILGAGSIAQAHARALRDLGDVDIPYVLASDVDRAMRWARDVVPEASVVSDLNVVLGDPSVDAVDICGHTVQRKEYAIASAAAGKTVLLEKPAALSTRELREMALAFERFGSVATVGQTVRFFPVVEKVADEIADGLAGRVVSIASAWYLGYWWPGGWRAWQARLDRSGGLLHNGVHAIDLGVALIDSMPTSVYAQGWGTFSAHVETPDSFQIIVRYENGAMSLHDMSYAPRIRGENIRSLLVMGSGGTIYADTSDELPMTSRPAGPPESIRNAMVRQMNHWSEVVRGEATPRVTMLHVQWVLAAAEAAERSRQSGRFETVERLL